jgi:hypothetical protein
LKHLREIGIFERREEFDRAETDLRGYVPNKRPALPYPV